MPGEILVPYEEQHKSLLAPSSVSLYPAFLRIHSRIYQSPHTEQASKNNEWMGISVSFGLVTDCCVTSYPKAHCLSNKHLSFLMAFFLVVCKFGKKNWMGSCPVDSHRKFSQKEARTAVLWSLSASWRMFAWWLGHMAGKLALPVDRRPQFLSTGFLQWLTTWWPASRRVMIQES